MIFLTGLFAFVFVVLVVCNLGGIFKISNGAINPYLLFDHQTVLEDSNWENIQTKYNDYQNNLPLKGKNSISGIDNIVSIAQEFEKMGHITDPGSMYFYGWSHSDPLPLCITNEVLGTWTGYVDVKGGYLSYEDTYKFSKICIEQKDSYVGKIRVTWTPGPYTPIDEDQNGIPECYYRTYTASFTVEDDSGDIMPGDGVIQLEATHYPIVTDDTTPGTFVPSTFWDPTMVIPDKEVDLTFKSWWTGCGLPYQGFAIISVRDNYQFPK